MRTVITPRNAPLEVGTAFVLPPHALLPAASPVPSGLLRADGDADRTEKGNTAAPSTKTEPPSPSSPTLPTRVVSGSPALM